jgi:hypothetical protein
MRKAGIGFPPASRSDSKKSIASDSKNLKQFVGDLPQGSERRTVFLPG